MEQAAGTRSRLAVASLVLSLLFFLPLAGVAAVILGAVALSKIARSKGAIYGQPLAMAGVIIGGLRIVFTPILAILLAMLLPALTRARESARRVNCSSNIHQLLLAMKMYSMDYEGCFPMDGPPGEATEPGSLQLLLDENCGASPAVFMCPAHGQAGVTGELTEETCSYKYVLGLTANSDPNAPILYCEHHEGGRNVGYVDGHVSWERSSD